MRFEKMTMRFSDHRFVSAGEMSATIDFILTRCHAKACTSEYDVMANLPQKV